MASAWPPASGAASSVASNDQPAPANSQMTVAPRAFACSSDSMRNMPAPSPRTKPLRRASKGRDACSGRSFQSFVRAPSTPIEAMASGEMIASAAPASSISASPVRMRLKAWPRASVPEAQALLIVVLGPRTPRTRPMRAAAMCGASFGMSIGSTRVGPRSSMTCSCFPI